MGCLALLGSDGRLPRPRAGVLAQCVCGFGPSDCCEGCCCCCWGKKMVERGWAEEFSSFDHLCRKFGGDSVCSPLSKIGLVSKQRND
eukprot:5551725-Amphidinium_carterae.1